MATYNIYTCSALVIISCLVTISAHVQDTWGSSPCLAPGKDSEMMVARDIITLSLLEIQSIRNFINTIPRLKSLEGADETLEMLGCLRGLTENLKELKLTLRATRHLKSPYLSSNAYSLKNKMDHTLTMSKECTTIAKVVDNIFTAMLSRKVVDLSLMVNDVLYRVSRLETSSTPTADEIRRSASKVIN